MQKICKKRLTIQQDKSGHKKIARFFDFKKIFFILILSAILVFLFNNSSSVLAQSPDVGIEYAENLDLQGGGQDVRDFLVRAVQVILGFLGIIAVIYVMYAGWLWMTSEGSEDKVSKAKKTLVNAVIGLIIMLSAFMIVTWIINSMNMGGGGGTSNPRPGKPSYNGGIGVLGSCIIENVYPEPNQTEVPRNTSIIVTFKEEVNPETICNDAAALGGNNDGIWCNGDRASSTTFRLYKQIEGDGCPASCANNVTEISVYTNDNKTFVFVPDNYIGSPSEYLWYEVYLSNDILKLADGKGVFDNCRTDFMNWAFHVSDKIDLTPPQVLNGGIFPAEDDARDIYSGAAAVASEGIINFSSNPEPGQDAIMIGTATANGSSPIIDATSIVIDPDSNQVGTLLVSLPLSSDGQTAQLSNGSTLLGSAVFSGKSINFPGYLSFTIDDFPEAGDSWNFPDMEAQIDSDILRIGSVGYKFVETMSGSNQIEVDSVLATTISNTASAINLNSEATATVGAGNTIDVNAKVAGVSGNSIFFTTTSGNISLVPTLGYLNGGSNSQVVVTVQDREDKARNAVIQINFNEAIMPITVSGNADDVEDYIRVVNNDSAAQSNAAGCANDNDCLSFECSTAGICVNNYLAGEFILSNVYKTVEFLSDNLCGVNGCGEEIYCLPASSTIRVEIEAATLDGPNNCAARSPFFNNGVHCEDATGNFFPLSLIPMDGVMDAAMNSLDGDRSTFAESKSGSLSDYYNENLASGDGDSYLWSFFINDQIDLIPPVVDSVFPTIGASGVDVEDNITLGFSKVMMCGSIRTGTKKIVNGADTITHHNFNAWSVGGAGFGYWTACLGVDDGPIDGEYDWSEAQLRHSDFPDTTSFRSQAGSGLKDIYQNCYKPSGDSFGCSVNDTTPSCCDGVVTGGLDVEGNCP